MCKYLTIAKHIVRPQNLMETNLMIGARRRLKRVINQHRGFVTLKPKTKLIKGRVLLSYLIAPFSIEKAELINSTHSNLWECRQIAQTFLDFGYVVDVIDWDNSHFKPHHNYNFCIDIYRNLARLAFLLNKDCLKILHITGAHPLFQNKAEYERLLALQRRYGTTLLPRRLVQPSLGIEIADYATILGNQFTQGTFNYAKKTIIPIPLSATTLYPWLEEKNFEACSHSFLWLGSSGLVLKGLDLVLEAFVGLPDYHLTVCGPVKNEADFEQAFYKELNHTSNIKTTGWIDTNSLEFQEITKRCIGIVYPSSSEGQAGSVITCLHAGLIPIISYQSGVDIANFGVILEECSIEEIQHAIKTLSAKPTQELKNRARQAWEFARANHTREKFAEAYRNFAINILGLQN